MRVRGEDVRAPVPLGPPDGHAVLIHHGAVERARAAAAWAIRGVAANEQVLFEAVDMTDADAFLTAVDTLEPNIDPDQLQVLEAGTVSSAPLLLARVERAVELGYLGLRLAGANGHRLADLEADDYARHEASVELLSHDLPVLPLCAFDTAELFPATVERAIREHARISGPDFRVEVGTASLCLAGALDVAAEPVVARTLARVIEWSQGPDPIVSVDLMRVSALSAANARTIIEGSRTFRESGGRVEVWSGPTGRLVLGLMQVEREEGLLILHDDPW